MINLKKLYTDYPECFKDSAKFKAYLIDLYPAEKKAHINVLATMLAEGVLSLAQTEDTFDDAAFCKRICDDYGYSEKLTEECFIAFSAIYHEIQYIPTQSDSEQQGKSELPIKPLSNSRLTSKSSLSDFEIENGKLKHYNGKGGDVVIPEGVKNIGWGAFENCSGLTSVTIPNSVTSIGGAAFEKCSNLAIVYWNATACAIAGGYEEYERDYGEEPFSSPTHLERDYTIFQRCINLKSIIIGKNVELIPAYAFYNCSNLTSIVIPETVKRIESGAFLGCRSLTIYCEAIKKPRDWAVAKGSYGDYSPPWNHDCPVIWNCKNRDKDENGYAYAVIDGLRYSLKNNIATVVRQSSNIAIANIHSVVIYNNESYVVTSILDSAFKNCSGLTSVVIPDSVTKIGKQAFTGCKLTSVTIGSKVRYIPSNAFVNDPWRLHIDIPIKNIKYTGNIASWCTIDGLDNIMGDGNNPKTLTINGQEITGELIIPEGVMEIQVSAFSGCSGLTGVTILDSVTQIGDYAFSGCSGLKEITIADSVTNIGKGAFKKCAHLTIYCKAKFKPIGWKKGWNPNNRPVVWGYKGQKSYTEKK